MSAFRSGILKEFANASKLCCEQYGSHSQLATESDSNVREIIDVLEALLSHGLKHPEQQKTSSSSLFSLRQVGEFANAIVFGPSNLSGPVLWDYVKKFLSRHEHERFLMLQHVFTDCGRGRAWLRTSLNEHSLERYLATMVADESKLSQAYEEFAFMRDYEKVGQLVSGVSALSRGILFALTIDKNELDREVPALNKYLSLQETAVEDNTPSNLVATLALSPGKPAVDPGLRPKRKPVKVIMTFNDDVSPVSPPINIPSWLNKNQDHLAGSLSVENVSRPPQRSSSFSELSFRHRDLDVVGSECEELQPRLELVNVDGNILLPMAGALQPESPAARDKGESSFYGQSPEQSSELATHFRDLELQFETATEDKLRLVAELETSKQSAEDARVCYEIRIKTLGRENDLLKAQLKKYVSAVQLLKHDDEQAHDTLERLKELNRVHLQNAELGKYEEKLVQVAEMHAELMEFNTRLQRSLQIKDATIRRLQDELIELRGPLPVENGVNVEEDNFSMASEDDGMGLGSSRTLINIWIPSAFLARNSGSEHHVYQIYIRIRDEEWNVYRRFSQFYTFHKQLIKQDPLVGTFDFPPKKTVGNKDSKCVEDRRKRLQSYLRAVVNFWVTKHEELSNTPDKETLLGLLSFFGDASHTVRPRGSRNRFTARFRGSQPDVSGIASPLYNGL